MSDDGAFIAKSMRYSLMALVAYTVLDFMALRHWVPDPFLPGIRYFYISFTGLTIILLFRLLRVAGSGNEQRKGKNVITGMAGHFVGSLVIILLYYLFIYEDLVADVIIALLMYAISFVLFIAAATKMD